MFVCVSNNWWLCESVVKLVFATHTHTHTCSDETGFDDADAGEKNIWEYARVSLSPLSRPPKRLMWAAQALSGCNDIKEQRSDSRSPSLSLSLLLVVVVSLSRDQLNFQSSFWHRRVLRCWSVQCLSVRIIYIHRALIPSSPMRDFPFFHFSSVWRIVVEV